MLSGGLRIGRGNRWQGRALALVSVMVVASCASDPPQSSPSPPPQVGAPTVYDQLFDRVGPEGEVDLQLAVDAFSLVIAPLPGAAPVAGADPEPHQRAEGSFAVDWILRHYEALTPEQRAGVDAALATDDDAIVVMPDGTVRTFGDEVRGEQRGLRPAGMMAALALPQIGVVAAAEPRTGVIAAAAPEDRQWWVDVLMEAKRIIAVNLGRDFSRPVILEFNDQAPSDPDLNTALAYAWPSNPLSLETLFQSGCQIRVNPALRAPPYDETDARTTLAHEMFHCFQYATLGWKSPASVGVPGWVTEGQAEWVGEAVYGGSATGLSYWEEYLKSANRSLWSRTYDAVGFYFHMQEVGIAPWLHLDAMLHATDNADRFRAARANEDAFLDSWASSLLRQPFLVPGKEWNAVALWETGANELPDRLTLVAGSSSTVLAGVVRNTNYLVHSRADVVEARIQGHARLHRGASGGDRVDGLEQMWLCTKPGGCECPAGEVFSGPDLVNVDAGFFLALTGGLGGSEGQLTGHALDEFCDPRPSLPPVDYTGAPCSGGRCAATNGDPHLKTVDGVGYEFMGAGEYVLLRSPDASLEIQARQEPVRGSANTTVNTAIAARVGASRIVIHPEAEGFDSPYGVAVDGQLVDASTPIDLDGGGRVAVHSGGVQVDFPDGTQLWAHGDCCLNVMISPSDTLIANGVGLLGNVVPDKMRVPAMPDGTRLPPAIDAHDHYVSLYEVLGPAWAVTQQTTLFDYEEGESPETFAIPGFPEEARLLTFADLTGEKRVAAEGLCAAVDDQDLFEQCVFDIFVTDLSEFAEQYVLTVELERQGPVAIGAPPPQPPLPPPDDLPEDFLVVTSGVDSVIDTELASDGRLYATVRRADGGYAALAIDTASGALLAERELELAKQVEATADSVWVGAYHENGYTCIIVRLEPGTLAERATIEVPCDVFGTQFAALGDTVWYLDRTTADIDARGGELRRIDPATNTPAESVEVGFVNGQLLASDSAVFWYADLTDDTSPDAGVFRLVEGAAELEPLGPALGREMYPGGDGLWTQHDATAVRWSSPAGADAAVPIEGNVVGADQTGVFVDGSSGVDTVVLWHYEPSGASVEVARSIQLDTSAGYRSLDYGWGAPLAVGGGMVAQLWLVPSAQDPSVVDLVMQALPAP